MVGGTGEFGEHWQITKKILKRKITTHAHKWVGK